MLHEVVDFCLSSAVNSVMISDVTSAVTQVVNCIVSSDLNHITSHGQDRLKSFKLNNTYSDFTLRISNEDLCFLANIFDLFRYL